MNLHCNLCNAKTLEQIYTLDARAVTSLRAANTHETSIWFCPACGHTLTEPQPNIDVFYAEHYNILTGSEDEDQLLHITDGKKIFRSDFQAAMLNRALPAGENLRILDYGGAKGATLKKLMATRNISPFIFDVSENYSPFWSGTIPPENQAVNDLPPAWLSTMDVVYSFFCLEHVADPIAALRAQFALLKEGGLCHLVVPNIYTNVADLLVIDHINHFAECSLHYALAKAGFSNITMDGNTQPGWWIVTARRETAARTNAALPAPAIVQTTQQEIHHIADNWKQITARIARYTPKPHAHIAIYGAGFYGTYAALHLDPNITFECFVDQNSFLHGTTHMDRPVIAPTDLPAHITTLLIALNPAHARATIAAMDIARRPLDFEFIFEGNP